MTTLRIRGLYAVALTQLFRQFPDAWEIVQPDEDVRACIGHDWRMDSPDVAIDDVPDRQGRRETIRVAGSAEAVQQALRVLQEHCLDVITHMDSLQVGAIYMGLVGIYSRTRRQAVVYLGNQLAGVLPLRYEDRDLRVGTQLPVRIAALRAEADERPQLSTSLTLPGDYAVLTSAQAVRLSKQITDPRQQERLQRLGEQCQTDGWGIIWRTAAQHAEDQALVAEVTRLVQEAGALRSSLEATHRLGYVHGGEMMAQVYLPGHAKTLCDTLRMQLLPTLPGHHKYKAQGDVYAATVEALEKELPADVLRTRTMTLRVLSSLDAMQPQPIHNRLRLVARRLDGAFHEQAGVERVGDDLYAGWLDVRQPIRHKDAYPSDLRLDKQPGDYTATRFQEGSWSYTTHFYDRNGTWKAAYASLTTPLAIFVDQIQVVELPLVVMRSTKQKPQIRGLQALQQAEKWGLVTGELVRKAQAEADLLFAQLTQDANADSSAEE